MGRLKPEFLERVESFADRVLKMTEVLERQRRSRRIIDQIAAAPPRAPTPLKRTRR